MVASPRLSTPGEGFVEQQQVGSLGDAAGQERAFALPTGELPDLTVLVFVAEFSTLQCFIGGVLVGGPRPPGGTIRP